MRRRSHDVDEVAREIGEFGLATLPRGGKKKKMPSDPSVRKICGCVAVAPARTPGNVSAIDFRKNIGLFMTVSLVENYAFF